jgi:hypothetical protein
MRAWIDRTKWSSEMPADGISLPPKWDFGMSLRGGWKVRLSQPRDFRKGMPAYGTSRTLRDVRFLVAIRCNPDIGQAAFTRPRRGDFGGRPRPCLRETPSQNLWMQRFVGCPRRLRRRQQA